jgi:hypothetical protein
MMKKPISRRARGSAAIAERARFLGGMTQRVAGLRIHFCSPCNVLIFTTLRRFEA